jgi:hypothetical protein
VTHHPPCPDRTQGQLVPSETQGSQSDVAENPSLLDSDCGDITMLRNVRFCLQLTVDTATCRRISECRTLFYLSHYNMISLKCRYVFHSDGKYSVRSTYLGYAYKFTSRSERQ